MGAISFSVDRAAVTVLAESLGLTTFVETGTFHGDSLAAVRDLFKTLHSAEVDPELAMAAKIRFQGHVGVTIHQGSSPDVLRALHVTPLDGVFYWLDAHWCESAGSDPGGQCPLLAEIAAIGKVGRNSVLAIDDARLFLAPPTATHVVSDWPHFDELLVRLRLAAPDHHILILNDVIWTVPEAAFEPLIDYAARHGADWLAIAEKARTYDAIMAQLVDKDREIDVLTRENEVRLEVIGRLNATLEQVSKQQANECSATQFEHRLAALQAVADERARLIATLDSTARQASERATTMAEENRHLLSRSQALEAAVADLTERAVAATGRVDSLEKVAAERAALIERLDGIAHAMKQRAEALDGLASERAAALDLWQARAIAAEQQLVELTATATDAIARAQTAERECDSRQVVIDELVRARDAFSAALVGGPRLTRLGRLFFRNDR